MGMTSVEKIIANHSGQSVVTPGDVVVVDVDVAVYHEWFPPTMQTLKNRKPDLTASSIPTRSCSCTTMRSLRRPSTPPTRHD